MSEVVGPDGWATVPELLERVSRRTLTSWLAAGRLIRLRPGVLALPSAAVDGGLRGVELLQQAADDAGIGDDPLVGVALHGGRQ